MSWWSCRAAAAMSKNYTEEEKMKNARSRHMMQQQVQRCRCCDCQAARSAATVLGQCEKNVVRFSEKNEHFAIDWGVTCGVEVQICAQIAQVRAGNTEKY